MADKDNTNFCDARCCIDPLELFSTAAAVSILLYENLNVCQLNTIINLCSMITANLSGFVTQIEINSGEQVQPTV